MRLILVAGLLSCFSLSLNAALREYAFGAGATSSSLAGAGVASVSNAAATYLNPANLARCKRSAFEFGLRYATSQLSANQTEGETRRVYVGQDVLALELGGCAVPVEGLGVGVWTSSNMLRPLSLSLTTPNEDITFTRFGNGLSSPTMMVGVGYSFVSQVSLGVAVSVALHTQISQDVYAPLPGSTKPFSTDIGATVGARASVVAGLALHPWDFLSFGATFRTENYGRLDVDAQTQASALGVDIPPIHVKLAGLHDYSPRQIAAGVTIKPIEALSIITDLNYAFWSKYKGPFLTVRPDANSSLSTGIPLPLPGRHNFKNVFIPRLGAELTILEAFALRAGYSYHPQIISAPKMQTNIVDGDTHQFTLGGGYKTQNAFLGFKADVFVGLHVMPEGSVSKNPVVRPTTYTYGGFAVATGANAAVEF